MATPTTNQRPVTPVTTVTTFELPTNDGRPPLGGATPPLIPQATLEALERGAEIDRPPVSAPFSPRVEEGIPQTQQRRARENTRKTPPPVRLTLEQQAKAELLKTAVERVLDQHRNRAGCLKRLFIYLFGRIAYRGEIKQQQHIERKSLENLETAAKLLAEKEAARRFLSREEESTAQVKPAYTRGLERAIHTEHLDIEEATRPFREAFEQRVEVLRLDVNQHHCEVAFGLVETAFKAQRTVVANGRINPFHKPIFINKVLEGQVDTFGEQPLTQIAQDYVDFTKSLMTRFPGSFSSETQAEDQVKKAIFKAHPTPAEFDLAIATLRRGTEDSQPEESLPRQIRLLESLRNELSPQPPRGPGDNRRPDNQTGRPDPSREENQTQGTPRGGEPAQHNFLPTADVIPLHNLGGPIPSARVGTPLQPPVAVTPLLPGGQPLPLSEVISLPNLGRRFPSAHVGTPSQPPVAVTPLRAERQPSRIPEQPAPIPVRTPSPRISLTVPHETKAHHLGAVIVTNNVQDPNGFDLDGFADGMGGYFWQNSQTKEWFHRHPEITEDEWKNTGYYGEDVPRYTPPQNPTSVPMGGSGSAQQAGPTNTENPLGPQFEDPIRHEGTLVRRYKAPRGEWQIQNHRGIWQNTGYKGETWPPAGGYNLPPPAAPKRQEPPRSTVEAAPVPAKPEADTQPQRADSPVPAATQGTSSHIPSIPNQGVSSGLHMTLIPIPTRDSVQPAAVAQPAPSRQEAASAQASVKPAAVAKREHIRQEAALAPARAQPVAGQEVRIVLTAKDPRDIRPGDRIIQGSTGQKQ